MATSRLDAYLQAIKPEKSRTYFQSLIKEGQVMVNGKVITKAAYLVAESDKIVIQDVADKYVSRGGDKLEHAIQVFNLDLFGKSVLDIGASTGGFSDCSLQHGAAFVCAVDVGTNQLADKLKFNPKVHSIENLNFRYATKEDIPFAPYDIVVIDVSFISLAPIFDNLAQFVKEGAIIIALIKPQFAAGLEYVGKNGVVKSDKGQLAAINNTIQYANVNHFYLKGLTLSPITGKKSGNTEYLGLFCYEKVGQNININVNNIVLKRPVGRAE